jgi:cytochrome c oxidase assembly protein subunit 15
MLARVFSAQQFPRWVLATWIALYVNLVSGALVRVTNSGLGCPDWPLCHGRAVPPMAGHSVIEFSNRIFAGTVIVVTILNAFVAWRGIRSTMPTQWRLALAVAILTLAQGPLGAVTIITGLNPVVVGSHFLLFMIDLSLATVLLVDVRGDSPAIPRPPWLRAAVVVMLVWTFALIISGVVVTMAGTHPGSNDVPRMWNLLDAAYWHVRIAASFVAALAAFLYAIARLDVTNHRVPRLAWLVVSLTGAQIVIGEWQWRHQLPWWTVWLHVATATALWASTVALGRSLLSPAAQPSTAAVPGRVPQATTR